jgi:hypothetical protein
MHGFMMWPAAKSGTAIEVGTVVEVQTREGPGWRGGNGGAGKVRKVHVGAADGAVTYDVKYFMNGSEKGVLPQHVSVPGAMVKREVVKPEDFVPEDWVAAAAASAAQRAAAKATLAQRRVALKAAAQKNARETAEVGRPKEPTLAAVKTDAAASAGATPGAARGAKAKVGTLL